MSFILDALRKSEHERQRSALPGLAHVPLATPAATLPRWALVVIGLLGATVLGLGGAWWQSLRAPAIVAPPAAAERALPLPAPAATPVAPTREAPPPARVQATSPAIESATASPPASPPAASLAAAVTSPAPESAKPVVRDEPALPSAAALAAQGVPLPLLRLELHAFAEQPSDRFVFINGRKYVEGERLPEGPQVVAIRPTGAVLSYGGRSFLLVAE